MFTGIVRERGRVVSAERNGARARSDCGSRRRRRPPRPALGDSVSVNGCCLTRHRGRRRALVFDAVPETLARTTLGALERRGRGQPRAGAARGRAARRPLRPGPRRRRRRASARSSPRATARRLALELPAELLRYCVEKGSIAVDGVSLTIAALDDDGVEIALVPHTLEHDDARRARPGRRGQPRGRRAREVRRAARLAPEGYDPPRDGHDRRAPPPFATVEEAIEDIRHGKFVVVVDAADRENEGDLTIAAQFATPEAINFMATHARGLICLCLTEERCDELRAAADDRAQRDAVRHRLHGLDRGARRGHDRHLRRTTARARSRSRSTRARAPATSSSPATSSRCARARAACCGAPARPRPRSTSRGSPGSTRPASSAR